MMTNLTLCALTTVWVLLALQLALGSGCAAPKPRVAHVKGAMTAGHAYRTYALVEHPVNVGIVDAKMSEAIADAMSRAGYERSDTGVADLHIQYGLLVSQTSPLKGLPPGVVSGPSGNPDQRLAAGELLVASDTSSADSRKVVVIMAGERATNRVVWMGVSSEDVAEDNLQGAALAAVQHVMETFPVRDQWDSPTPGQR